MTQSGKNHEQGPPGKPPGIKDVPRLASVSAATVSQVLNDVPGARISVETRQRIHRAAAELGYVPNRLARGMRTGRSGMLGLISDTIATTPFAGSIVVGAQDAALKHGCTLVLVSTDGDPTVVQDEVGGAEAAVGELLAHGHRRIGFLTNEDDVPATHGRLEGYRSSLARAAIDFDPGLVLADESVTAGGDRTAHQMLDR